MLLESPYILMYPTRRNYDGSEFYSLAGRTGRRLVSHMMSIPRPIKADLDAWTASRQSRLVVGESAAGIEAHRSRSRLSAQSDSRQLGPDLCKAQACRRRALSAQAGAVRSRDSTGITAFDDQNEPNPYGIAPTARNIKDGKRQSSAVAYLDPARGRPNLTIVGTAQVTSLIVRGKKVEGVRYRKDGNERAATADKVVLSAGCIIRRKFSCSRASARALSSSATEFLSCVRWRASVKTIKIIRW